jgi:hypothetical protein
VHSTRPVPQETTISDLEKELVATVGAGKPLSKPQRDALKEHKAAVAAARAAVAPAAKRQRAAAVAAGRGGGGAQ